MEVHPYILIRKQQDLTFVSNLILLDDPGIQHFWHLGNTKEAAIK
jgi:hypothetical protein